MGTGGSGHGPKACYGRIAVASLRRIRLTCATERHRQAVEPVTTRGNWEEAPTEGGDELRLLIRLLINAGALWATAAILPDLSIEDGFWNLLLVALVFGLVNTLIRPVARLLTLPLRLMTLGLFTIVVNGLMVVLTAWLVDVLVIEGGFFNQVLIGTAAAIIITVISTALSIVLPD